MKDIFGYELRIGDTVAYNHPSSNVLTVGVIKELATNYTCVTYFDGNFQSHVNVIPSWNVAKKVDVG